MSYADLWTLAGVVAVEEMGGPTIPWKAGRTDSPSPTTVRCGAVQCGVVRCDVEYSVVYAMLCGQIQAI